MKFEEVEVKKIGSDEQWQQMLESGSPDDLVTEGLSAGECREIVNTWRKLLGPDFVRRARPVIQDAINTALETL